MKIDAPTNLTIDGENYPVIDFSDKVQNLVGAELAAKSGAANDAPAAE